MSIPREATWVDPDMEPILAAMKAAGPIDYAALPIAEARAVFERGAAPWCALAPEIAAIEDLLYPAEREADASSDGTEPVRPARPRPTVLFVWGCKRVLPVRIASLKIDESVYNTALNPVRAEIEAALEVLGEAEARADLAVRSALDKLMSDRRNLAQMYYQNTSVQGSNILPL